MTSSTAALRNHSVLRAYLKTLKVGPYCEMRRIHPQTSSESMSQTALLDFFLCVEKTFTNKSHMLCGANVFIFRKSLEKKAQSLEI